MPKAVRPGPTPKPAKRSRGSAVASKARIEEIFRRFQAANPEPKGELEYVNPYTLLVAVVLSAQATDAGVNKATRGLFKVADSPAKMIALGLDEVQERIKTIGLYRNKAKNVVAARPPMSCSISPSARRRWPSTRTSSASPTAWISPPARRRWRSKWASCG